MIREAIQEIAALARKSAAVEVVEIIKLEKVAVRRGDAVEIHDIPPPRRKASLRGLQDLVAIIVDRTIAPAPEVYYDRTAVSVLLDRNDRRAVVVCQLQKTERWARLESLAAGVKFTPKEAIRLFRFELPSVGSQRLIDALRKVDFERKGTGASTVQHGRESLGKSVEIVVQQADQIPESIRIEIPVFSNPGLRFSASVEVGIYVDLEREAIEIRPLADEIESGIEAAQAQIALALNEELDDLDPKPLVLHGVP